MKNKLLSIRPFIGAKNFETSRSFYKALGFEESVLSGNMSYFNKESLGFYLQDYYVKDWVDNTMVFMEVEDVEMYWNSLVALELTTRFDNVRLLPIKHDDWGSECFLIDPSGVLWHFGQFKGQ